MTNYSTGFDQPGDTTSQGLGFGTAMLLFLTLTVIALACFLATYLTNTATVMRLQQAGFIVWSGSSIWADLLQIPLPWISSGSSVWYHIDPGGKLSFAFTTLPQLRAGASATLFLIGGLLCLNATVRRKKLQQKNKSVGVAFAILLCILGIAAAFPTAPGGFCISLNQNTISTGLQPGDPVIPFSVSRGFTEHTHFGRRSSTSYVDATDDNGQQFDIITLGSQSQAIALATALNNFLASHGLEI
jgi:hypothetical protein